MVEKKLTQPALAARLSAAASKVQIGSIYRHYKNKKYQVVGVALLEEDSNVACVIYQAQYGAHATFIRRLDNWLQTVEVDGKRVKRFTKLDT